MNYHYALHSRPLSIGTTPVGFTELIQKPIPAEFKDHEKYCNFGIVSYDHKLTTKQCFDYELIFIADEAALKELSTQVISGMGEYKKDYLAMGQESLADFERNVIHQTKSIAIESYGYRVSIGDELNFSLRVFSDLNNFIQKEMMNNQDWVSKQEVIQIQTNDFSSKRLKNPVKRLSPLSLGF